MKQKNIIMKNSTIIFGAVGAGLLYFLWKKSQASQTPAPIPSGPPAGSSAAQNPPIPLQNQITGSSVQDVITYPFINGQINSAIKNLQIALNSCGANIVVDSTWGPNTSAALENFAQESNIQGPDDYNNVIDELQALAANQPSVSPLWNNVLVQPGITN